LSQITIRNYIFHGEVKKHEIGKIANIHVAKSVFGPQ